MEHEKHDKPKTVKVIATEDHTAFGKSYKVDDEYDVDEAFVDTLEAQGKAVRADHPKAAKKSGHAVEPMTTHDKHKK